MDNPYVSSNVVSRFTTKIKAGTNYISEIFDNENSRKGSR